MVVLDTHAWIWWVTQNRKLLPATLHEYLSRERVPHNISAISVYEVSVLAGRGRVNVGMPIHEWIDEATDGSNIRVIPVDKQIAEYAGILPDIHGDPMDRIIIATSLLQEATLVTKDHWIHQYPDLNTLWE